MNTYKGVLGLLYNYNIFRDYGKTCLILFSPYFLFPPLIFYKASGISLLKNLIYLLEKFLEFPNPYTACISDTL